MRQPHQPPKQKRKRKPKSWVTRIGHQNSQTPKITRTTNPLYVQLSLLISSTPFMLDLADNNHSSNVNKNDAECMETTSDEAINLILRIQP